MALKPYSERASVPLSREASRSVLEYLARPVNSPTHDERIREAEAVYRELSSTETASEYLERLKLERLKRDH